MPGAAAALTEHQDQQVALAHRHDGVELSGAAGVIQAGRELADDRAQGGGGRQLDRARPRTPSPIRSASMAARSARRATSLSLVLNGSAAMSSSWVVSPAASPANQRSATARAAGSRRWAARRPASWAGARAGDGLGALGLPFGGGNLLLHRGDLPRWAGLLSSRRCKRRGPPAVDEPPVDVAAPAPRTAAAAGRRPARAVAVGGRVVRGCSGRRPRSRTAVHPGRSASGRRCCRWPSGSRAADRDTGRRCRRRRSPRRRTRADPMPEPRPPCRWSRRRSGRTPARSSRLQSLTGPRATFRPTPRAAEAPQLMDAPVHARDVGGERRRPGVERGLVAGPHLGDEVLQRGLHAGRPLLELAGLRRLLLLGQLAIRGDVGTEQVLVVLGGKRQLDPLVLGQVRRRRSCCRAPRATAAATRRRLRAAARGRRSRASARAAWRGIAQRQQGLSAAVRAVLADTSGFTCGVTSGALRPSSDFCSSSCAICSFSPPTLLVGAIRLVGGGLVALLGLHQVRVGGAGLHLGAVVLLRQVLRVGRRRDVLVVVEIDHLLVRLGRRRRWWRRHRSDGGATTSGSGFSFFGSAAPAFSSVGRLGSSPASFYRFFRASLLGVRLQRLRRRLDGRQVGRQRGLIGLLERDVDLLGALRLLAPTIDPGRHHDRRDDVEVGQQRDQRAAREIPRARVDNRCRIRGGQRNTRLPARPVGRRASAHVFSENIIQRRMSRARGSFHTRILR